MEGTRTSLVFLESAVADRVSTVLLPAGIRSIIAAPGVDPATAFAMCAAQPVDFVVLGQRPDGSEAAVVREIRHIGIPVALIASASGLLQVNAARKSSGANIALAAGFNPADLAAAVKGFDLPSPDAVRKPVQMPLPAPAAEQDTAFLIARHGLRNTTGSLRIGSRTGNAECLVTLENGVPLRATSTVRGIRLGELLERKKRITADQVERALRVVEKKKVRIGQVLVDQGLVTPAEIAAAVSEQYVARVLTAFAWPQVAASVRYEAAPPDEARIPLRREALVTEGIRRQYDAARLKSLIPDGQVYSYSPDAGRRVGAFAFNAKEAAGIARVDGSRTAADIVGGAPSLLDAMRALYAAICFDLVRPEASPVSGTR